MTKGVQHSMDIIGAIKKINTNSLIYEFSKLSIEMFHKNECLMTLRYPVIRNGRRQICNVALAGWDILSIEYLSVMFSNDYRSSAAPPSPAELVSLYRSHENDVQRDMPQLKGNLAEIFRMILGMTSEQFKYQNLSWIFEKFNRNYHILIAGHNYEHRATIDVDAITQEIFGLSAKDYVALLVILIWLCMQHPDPLTAPESLYKTKSASILTQENLSNLISYYSCSYSELRSSPLGKQLLYSKPFIQTQRSGYLMSSIYSLLMMLANGLYWLVRDYYKNLGTQKFIDNFGLLFEDYVIDLANQYCDSGEWRQLPKARQKGADFLFSFDGVQMIVEAKSALIQLDTMQQTPNDDAIKKYYDNTIRKAYAQLESSCHALFADTDEKVIKVILLYDEFSNTSILEQSLPELFSPESNCFVMTIREFEIFLFLHRNNHDMQKEIITQIQKASYSKDSRVSFGSILSEMTLFDNMHLRADMDYFSMLLEHFRCQLQ